MAKEELPKIYERHWLNEDKGSAYIVIDGEVVEGYNKVDTWTELTVEIKDCRRQVQLEFCCFTDDKPSHEISLKKMDDFIAQLQKARAFLADNPPVKGKKSGR